jgi:hypothetical protein
VKNVLQVAHPKPGTGTEMSWKGRVRVMSVVDLGAWYMEGSKAFEAHKVRERNVAICTVCRLELIPVPPCCHQCHHKVNS